MGFPGLSTLPGWIEGAAETLQTLTIELPDLHRLPETMSRLKSLSIFAGSKQLILPSGIQHLNTLEDLLIVGCPEFCRKYKQEEEEEEEEEEE
ncbi:NBS-LRR disease resistance protein [Trifolium pratense]|uniref:NBS-LRR disease resistance protein n=1 Tax=Trifolium pratense TaxID=57577 RepID=A0A2K3JNB2_TRIPR|nr:NBS-LRR disease resistance protein [Trifolium pratense]